MKTEEAVRSVERQAQDILSASIWTDMKIVALIALVGGWDKKEIQEAVRELVYGLGWSKMARIAQEIEKPLQRFIDDVRKIKEENDRLKAEAKQMAHGPKLT